MIAVALARPGATMLALEPSFVMYRMSRGHRRAWATAGVALAEDFAIDLPATLAAVARLKPALTWIAYPNNPTGNLFDREAILAVVEASPGLVVVDEAVLRILGRATFLDEVGGTRTGARAHRLQAGLAGLRLGLAVGPRDWLASSTRSACRYNVNVLSAAAAEFILAATTSWMPRPATSCATAGGSRPGWTPSRASGALRRPRTSSWCACGRPACVRGAERAWYIGPHLHGSHPSSPTVSG